MEEWEWVEVRGSVERKQGQRTGYIRDQKEPLPGYQSREIGSFVQFVKHGYGIETFANGDQYMGYYANGKPHGTGEYQWTEGAKYRGQFQGGIREG